MKFLLLSDIHLMSSQPVGRLDNIRQTQMKKLNYVFESARENNCDILQAGDFFDSPRSWYLLPEMINLLRRYKDDGVDVFCIFGQHDSYMYSTERRANTSLGVLNTIGLINILTNEPIKRIDGGEYMYIYGASIRETVPPVINTKALNILVIHSPIADRPLWAEQKYSPAGDFLMRHEDYDLILCADIHRNFTLLDDGRYIVNTGPMIRKTAELYSFEHEPCFYIYNTEDKHLSSKHIIPHEPAERVLSRKHLKDDGLQLYTDFMSDFTRELKRTVEFSVKFKDNLDILIMKANPKESVVKKIDEVISKTQT